MANNQKITIEFKEDVEDIIKKIQEIATASTNAFSSMTTSIMKVSKGYLEMEKVGKFIKDANTMIGQFSNVMKKTSDEGTRGFERIKKVIIGSTEETKLATLASEAFKFALSPTGLALITAGIIGITVAFAGMLKKENEIIKTSQENLETIKQQQKQYKEMQNASKDALETSLVQTDLAKQYSKELLNLVDANGLVTGSQERVNFLIDQLNKLLPDAGFYFDEETGKIMDMNGEAANLSDTLENLIETQKAQAYLDAYQDDYAEALKNKNDLMKKQIDLYDKIQTKQSILDQYNEKSSKAAQEFGFGSAEYNQYMEEFFQSVGVSADEMISLAAEINTLNNEYTAGQETLKEYTDQINNFKAMQEALFNQDWDRVHQIMNGMGEFQLFDSTKGEEQIDALLAQQEGLEKIKSTLEAMKEDKQTIDEDYLESITEQLALAEEEVNKAAEKFGEETIELHRKTGIESGDALKETLDEKMSETGASMISQMTTDAQTGIDGINTVIASTPMNAVKIPVIYEPQNSPSAALGATVSMIGASYDDFIENPSMFTPFSSDASYFMAQARNTMQSLQSRLARGLVSMPVFETKLAGAGNKQVDVNQTNVFNVPVQKPSDVTRAIEKMNRELAKRL